jgi:predicted ATPase/DNA-binding SARP family transcriptional activator
MAPLRLFVLGPPRLERDGRPVEVHLRRALALLVYLAADARPHGREALAALLWPDSDEPEARGRLRRTLHRLTEALGDDVVAVDGDTLRLSPMLDLWLDSRAFEDHAATGLAPTEAAPSGPERLEHLTRAASLYADDFLAGFTLPDSAAWDEWQFLQREHLRQTFGQVLRSLVRAHRVQGAWEAGIGYARRWLALDPLHEPARRALMRLYAFAGQQAAALRQYQEGMRLLEAELGAAPESKTTALYEAIKARRLTPPTVQPARPPPAPDAWPPAAAAPMSASPRLRRRHTLPAQPTRLLGRDREQALVADRLLQEDTRLLTLTGPGGVGKTHLALQVAADLADRFEGGVSFVDLAPVLNPALVGAAIAQALGVGEAAGRRLPESVKDHLGEQQALLLLDNFEHLLAAAPLVADLLAACRRLKVLVTSRAMLHLRGEKEVAVPPLALPAREHVLSLPALGAYAAVALFVERARDARPDFAITSENAPSVAEICRRLEGLPLAIELAAARVKLLPPRALLARLDHRLALLTGGPRDLPARQQTLRDTIAWSYDLLSEPEQRLFRRLAVFVGGCELGAAEAVCAGDGLTPDEVLDLLSGLAAKSLVQTEERDEEVHYRFLESIREYAAEKLREAGEDALVRERHRDWLLALAEQAEPQLRGPHSVSWLERLEHERDNLRAALAWCVERGEAEAGLRLVAALARFWQIRVPYREIQAVLAELLASPAANEPSATVQTARMKALLAAGAQALRLGDRDVADMQYQEALAIGRQLGDQHGLAMALVSVGRVARVRGDYPAARQYDMEAIPVFEALGDDFWLARTYHHLGVAAFYEGDLATARERYEASLATFERLDDELGIVTVLEELGEVAYLQGDLDTARSLLGTTLEMARRINDKDRIAMALAALAGVAAVQRQATRALRLGAAAAALNASTGLSNSPAWHANFKRWLEPARQALTAESCAAAETAGRAMTLDEAIEYALAGDGPASEEPSERVASRHEPAQHARSPEA